VVFVRWKNSCDFALRFRVGVSLEHYDFCRAQRPVFEESKQKCQLPGVRTKPIYEADYNIGMMQSSIMLCRYAKRQNREQ
jgi:hypothetical protein